jgi:hypothetical protein
MSEERYEGLYEFRAELIKWAEDITLSDAGRTLSLALVEELDANVAKIKTGTWVTSYYSEQDDCSDYVRELHTYVTLSSKWHEFLVGIKHPSVQPTPSKPYVPPPKVVPVTTAPEVEVFQFEEGSNG